MLWYGDFLQSGGESIHTSKAIVETEGRANGTVLGGAKGFMRQGGAMIPSPDTDPALSKKPRYLLGWATAQGKEQNGALVFGRVKRNVRDSA